MPRRYEPSVLSATVRLVDAVNLGELDAARSAIQQGADINCRVIKIAGGYRIARDIELRQTAHSQHCNTSCYGNLCLPTDVVYEVPMVGTTTLLNILALSDIKTREKKLELAEMLMEHGAELGAIDYASYWEGWGDDAANYFQNTPLLNAIAAQNLQFADLYLRFLTRLEKDKRQEILDYKDKFEAGFHTALEFAVRRGFSQLATAIVRAGANPNPQPFIFAYAGKSPLHMACMSLGQAWVPSKKEWHSILGSDLELILTLIEHGADFNFAASTKIFDGNYDRVLRKWKEIALTPFDHIDIAVQNKTPRPFDVVDSCQEPAFKPKKIGQIVHPFHEEYSFRHLIIDALRSQQSRAKYLSSEVFQQRDKVVLQKAILKRILKEFSVQFDNPLDLTSASIDQQSVQATIDAMLQHPQFAWFTEQLEYAGIHYNADKSPKLQSALPIEQNPIATLAVRNKITRCMINDSDALLKNAPRSPQSRPSHFMTAGESAMPRRIALLDVDQTLLYNQRDMNDALIEALREEGITDVYLFTNMELSDVRCYGREGAPFSRMEVIDYLSTAGVEVKGVITPADPYLPRFSDDSPVDAAFQTFYLPLMQKRRAQNTSLDLNDYASEDTLEFLFAQLEWSRASYTLRESNRLQTGEIKSITQPGLCLIEKNTGKPTQPKQFIHHFEEAKAFFITGSDAIKNRERFLLEQQALPAEFNKEIREATYASSDPKGAMMAHLLLNRNIAQADTMLYFFDDRDDHLRAAAASHARHRSSEDSKLYTCHVSENLAEAIQQKTAYQACLRGTSVNAVATAAVTSEDIPPAITASFFLRVLAHPATKVVAALFIIAGIAGLICGGMGLAGISVGLSLIGATTLTAVSVGATGAGISLGIGGFFSSSRLKQEHQGQDHPTPIANVH